MTLINLHARPPNPDRDRSSYWPGPVIRPISKYSCNVFGFKCPGDELCDCATYCVNGQEFVQFRVVEGDRVYVTNQKLSPGTYCLPKGVGRCNLKTSRQVFSLAGWSCIPINGDVFRGDKLKACQNDEAADNRLNVLWDFDRDAEAGSDVEDYYERSNGPNRTLRYGCRCGSKSLDGTPLVSTFPFVCSVDFCLRDIENPDPSLGWNGSECVCGRYPHLDPNDRTSPCKREATRVENDELIGRVECMTDKSFVTRPLICPTDDPTVTFREFMFDGNDTGKFIEHLIQNRLIN